MLIYEIQGQRYPSEPEAETKRKMLSKHPPEAEVIVYQRDLLYYYADYHYEYRETEIDRLKLNDLWDEGIL